MIIQPIQNYLPAGTCQFESCKLTFWFIDTPRTDVFRSSDLRMDQVKSFKDSSTNFSWPILEYLEQFRILSNIYDEVFSENS